MDIVFCSLSAVLSLATAPSWVHVSLVLAPAPRLVGGPSTAALLSSAASFRLRDAISSVSRAGCVREAREARERATTERRLHAVILAEERAARDGIVRGIRDERRMRELGVEGMDAEKTDLEREEW